MDSEDVKIEDRGIIKNMRGILDPNVRTEVECDKATKDISVVLVLWISGNPDG